MEKIIVIGNGGHARSVVDTIEKQGIYEIGGYVVEDEGGATSIGDYPVIGRDSNLEEIFRNGIRNAVIGIGFLGRSDIRKKMYFELKRIGYSFPMICDPTAIIASRITADEGTFVGKGAVINTGVRIGRMSIINTGAIVEHDCQIGDFSHVAVGAVLCGGVLLGEETFVGANATVIQGINIQKGSIVGAGETVRRNMPERTLYYHGREKIIRKK